ncbi:MAG: mechanosensitive ion channel family protein [Patescibacteria group bacterium]|nr:mechanosensitive ion channel family protein [Patescibacteria group bacterium]
MLSIISEFINWIGLHGTSIIRILFLALFYYIIFEILVWRICKMIEKSVTRKKEKEIAEQRAETIKSALIKVGSIVFFIGIFISILAESGLNVLPFLATFGAVGVIVGFGLQSVVKDIVNGALIIGEGQYSKGDIIEIEGKKGTVEKVSLRRTVLRDLDGTAHHIPNSLVGIVSNMSQDWAGINLDVKIKSSEDIDKAINILNTVGEEVYSNKLYKPLMLDVPKVLGVNELDESGITIKMIGKTKHLKKWDVKKELLKRIKLTFDRENIKMA